MRLALVMIVMICAAGYASTPPPDDSSVMLQALDAIAHGQWWIVAGATLTLVHLMLSRYALEDWWWFGRGGVREDAAKVGLAAVLAITGGLGHAILAGAPIDGALFLAMAKTLIAGTTFYVVPKKVGGVLLKSKRDAEPPFPGGPP